MLRDDIRILVKDDEANRSDGKKFLVNNPPTRSELTLFHSPKSLRTRPA